jgi:hypothetical protein
MITSTAVQPFESVVVTEYVVVTVGLTEGLAPVGTVPWLAALLLA